MTSFKRSVRGFTLIEIVVVVLIIAVLLAIAIPNFLKARESSRARTCQTNMREIDQAKEHWAMDTNAGSADTPTKDELVTEYMRARHEDKLPPCPAGGDYLIKSMGELPECTVGANGAGNTDDHTIQ